MRWDGLFADLEAQAAALERTERAVEIDERVRIEIGALGLFDRLSAAIGTSVRIRSVAAVTTTGALQRVATDWVLVDDHDGRETVVALDHVVAVSGLGRLSSAPGQGGAVLSRLGIRQALRAIARDRSVAVVCLADASTVISTIDRVGKDFIEVALHDGQARRRGEVRQVQLLPIRALVAVRRDT